MVSVKEQLVTGSNRLVSQGTNTKGGVTIHDTANTGRGANAQAHANLQSNGNSRQASWHYQVDDAQAIRSYKHGDICWHAGAVSGNHHRIAIEICINSDGNYKKAVQNAAELTAQILKQEGLTPDNVDRHQTHSGKYCPRQILEGRDGITWAKFMEMVRKEFGGSSKPSKPATPSKPASGGNKKLTAQQVAQQIYAGQGNWGNDPGRTQKLRAAGYDAADVQRRVNALAGVKTPSKSPAPSKPKKLTVDQVARQIMNGQGGWGNDPGRTQKLRAAGYNPTTVQNRVNQLARGGSSSSSSSSGRLTVDQVARQIINGQGNWGNDPERARKLRAAGYDAAAVQRRVNQLA